MTDLEQGKYQVRKLIYAFPGRLSHVMCPIELRVALEHLRKEERRVGQASAVGHQQPAILAQRALAHTGSAPV